MSESVIERELRGLLAERTHAAAHTIDLDGDVRKAFDLDSLAGLRLLALVEKHFHVRFPDERLSEFRTLRTIIDLIAAQHPEK